MQALLPRGGHRAASWKLRSPSQPSVGRSLWLSRHCGCSGNRWYYGTSTTSDDDSSFTTTTSFAEQRLSSPIRRALAQMGLEKMTDIQAATLAPALAGRDVLGRARTGTGKTVAFLVPSLQRTAPKSSRSAKGHRGRQAPRRVQVLVISPTRELASQIGDQAEALLSEASGTNKRGVQVMFGGTKKQRDVTRLERSMPDVVVATPGRLLDHLRNTTLRNGAFRGLFNKLQVLILDEADQLLEMGFRNDIMEILHHLPAEKQTLLFSATLPPAVREVMAKTMHDDFVTVDCVGENGNSGELSSVTHSSKQVPQSHVVLSSNCRAVSSVLEVIQDAQASAPSNYKIIAFFPTVRCLYI